MNKEKLSLYVPEHTSEKLKAIAGLYNLSTNKLLNLLILNLIESERNKLKLELTKAGIEL